MPKYPYLPIFELSRGDAIESVHYGSFAIVNSLGDLVESYGDPYSIVFLRSSAKPFQMIPLIENDGYQRWDFSQREIAIMCASHTGTDDHFNVLSRIQSKINVTQDDLLCGIHPPIDDPTRQAMLVRGEHPTPNRHNCSGKHTGMLAQAIDINGSIDNYIDFNHPIQKRILQCFSEMCDIGVEEIIVGVDGCSAPVFAIPLWNAALAYARLCDPLNLPPQRASACRTITGAMVSHPDMISGTGTFDTRLMEISRGKIVSKGGAEGIQQVGIMPDVIKPGSPGVGIILKISDGDGKGRARPAVTLEILRRLGALTSNELDALSNLGPIFPVKNWRDFTVGEAHPIF
jgi:L-asparaginase II